MSDLIVLGVILLALNRLDKIDGESYERNRVTYEVADTFADARCCHRSCETLYESVDAVQPDRESDDGEYPEHQTAIQAAPEESQGRCSRDTGKQK
jgi:hypothetical protein